MSRSKRYEGTLKIRVRIQSENVMDLAQLRQHLLEQHPGLRLGKPREGTNPKYDGRQKWACYGDIIIYPPDDRAVIYEAVRIRHKERKK